MPITRRPPPGCAETERTRGRRSARTATCSSRRWHSPTGGSGGDGVRVFLDSYAPAVSVHFVDEDLHRRAVSAYRATLRRRSSLVDHVSFVAMRDLGFDAAFAFDDDFTEAGFRQLPAQ